jgi:outer membrane lipoprotein-sorting protein
MKFCTAFLSLLFGVALGVTAPAAQTVPPQGAPPQTAPAQPPPAAAQPAALTNPTVDDVVALNLKARGGVELLRATESMKMSGTITSPTGPAKMTIWVKRPNRKRTETEFGGQKSVMAFDGTTAWGAMGSMPPQVIPPSPQLEEAKGRSEMDPALLDYREKGRRVELAGREKVDGSDVFHLRITDKGQVTHYYVDAVTGLERKQTNQISDGQNVARMELRFSDFRDVQGRMVPFTVQQVVDGKPVAQTYKVESVEFNIPIDDALFKMPGKAPK